MAQEVVGIYPLCTHPANPGGRKKLSEMTHLEMFMVEPCVHFLIVL